MNLFKIFTSKAFWIFTSLVIVLLLFPLIAFWTDRTLEFWLSEWLKREITVPYWCALVITIIFNVVILAINILSEILRIIIF